MDTVKKHSRFEGVADSDGSACKSRLDLEKRGVHADSAEAWLSFF